MQPFVRFSHNALPYLVLAAFAGVFLYPFVRELTDAPDAGVFLNGAAMVAQGAIPSRDFIEPAGPGSFLWLALFFRMFGTALATAHSLLSATGVGITLLVFYLSRRLGASGLFAALFVLAMLVPLLPHNSPHYDSTLFALAAFAVFLIAWDRPVASMYVPLIACGALLGLTTWFVQQKGLYLAAALVAAVLFRLRRRGLRPVIILLAAYGVVVALQFAWFAMLHALPSLIYSNYVLPLTSYGEINAAPYGFPLWQNLWPSFLSASRNQSIVPLAWTEAAIQAVPFLLVMALPLLLPLAAFVAKVSPLEPRVLPYWLTAYALWLSELHRLDIGHLRNGCVLMMVLFFSMCETSLNPFLKRAAFGLVGCLAFGATSHFMGACDANIAVRTRRGVIYSETSQPVVSFLQEHTKPGEEVFVYPYQPVYYFLADLRNPTRYSCLLYHYNLDSQFREAVRDLERKKVRYVVYDDQLSGPGLMRVFPAYRHPDAAHLIMEPYLQKHYRAVETAGRFRILERRD